MAFNPASLLFGEFIVTLAAVFGGFGGWLVGNLMLLGLVTVIILAARNRVSLAQQLNLSNKRLRWYATLGICLLLQYVFYTSNLTFPPVGAFITALTMTVIISWSLESVAPVSY
jgi:hypothetical protein